MDEISAHKYLKDNFESTTGNVLLGIGDDCAALQLNPGKILLTTNDIQVENTHFKRENTSPEQIGQKAVLASLSDIAAMGGVPRFILSSVGLRKEDEQQIFTQITDGINKACCDYAVDLVGGNLTGSEKLFVEITVLGEADPNLYVKRSTAKPGDKIFVTGTLGDSALGLKLMENNDRSALPKSLIDRHLKPSPRISTGKLLAERKLAGAMIDVSDGLFLDLGRITLNFDLGAEIFLEKLPLSECFKKYTKDNLENRFDLAVTGGEDYELLFTSSPDNSEQIKDIEAETGVKITEIGKVNKSADIVFIDVGGKKRKFKSRGYTHFN